LIAKVKQIPSDLLLYRSSLWDIGLAIGILDEFFWFRPPVQFFPPHRHIFNEIVKHCVKEEKKDDE
jgi:hypothetical protein